MTRAASLILLGYAWAQLSQVGTVEAWLWWGIILGILSGWLSILSRAVESAPNARAREERPLLNPNKGAPMATYRDDNSRTFVVDELAWRRAPVDQHLGQFAHPTTDPFGLGL